MHFVPFSLVFQELEKMVGPRVTLPDLGVVPCLNPALLPRRKLHAKFVLERSRVPVKGF